MTRSLDPSRPSERQPEGGFTLVEGLIALAMTTVLLVAALGLFDYSNKIARIQAHTSELQQAQRVAQGELVRAVQVAGRGRATGSRNVCGGLGTCIQAPQWAVGVDNNVTDPTYIVAGSTDTPLLVRPGTDVLRVRGAFESLFEPTSSSMSATGGEVVIDPTSPSGFEQPLTMLEDIIDEDLEVPLLMISNWGEFGLVELDHANSVVTSNASGPTQVILRFERTAAYDALAPGGAVWMNSPQRLLWTVGVMEEHRYYVRQNPGTDGTPQPRLSRARVYAGTEIPLKNDNDFLTEDIADDIIDLQVAVGVDTATIDINGDTIPDIGDGLVTEVAAAKDDDEWLGNFVDDALALPANSNIFYVRVTTLARTHRPDHGYVDEAIVSIEDRTYGEAPDPPSPPLERRFRRRSLATTVDLRNL